MNAQAVDVELSGNDIKEIESIIAKYPNIGDRYPESAMQLVNK